MQLKEDYTRNNLEYINGDLCIHGLSLEEIASEYGTPLYLYNAGRIRENFAAYTDAFNFMDSLICYAVKANFNGSIIRIISSLGGGADVVSGGELYMALRAGIEPDRIVFAGVGKTEKEIREAVKAEILLINIESEQELEMVRKVAKQEGKTANIALRINPDISAETHPKIATGLKENKFGIPKEKGLELYEKASLLEELNTAGLHFHIGSQILDISPFGQVARQAVEYLNMLRDKGIDIKYIDIGGGLGINYEKKSAPTPYDIAELIKDYFESQQVTLILEPGRSIVGEAGFLLTKINYVKENPEKNFVVVDAGFNDLIRPAMYGAYHDILPVGDEGKKMKADIVGPVCESGDFIAIDREVEGIKPGNYLAVCDVGAYGFCMSSNYNGRLRPAEVLIEENDVRLIRRREEYETLIQTENEI